MTYMPRNVLLGRAARECVSERDGAAAKEAGSVCGWILSTDLAFELSNDIFKYLRHVRRIAPAVAQKTHARKKKQHTRIPAVLSALVFAELCILSAPPDVAHGIKRRPSRQPAAQGGRWVWGYIVARRRDKGSVLAYPLASMLSFAASAVSAPPICLKNVISACDARKQEQKTAKDEEQRRANKNEAGRREGAGTQMKRRIEARARRADKISRAPPDKEGSGSGAVRAAIRAAKNKKKKQTCSARILAWMSVKMSS